MRNWFHIQMQQEAEYCATYPAGLREATALPQERARKLSKLSAAEYDDFLHHGESFNIHVENVNPKE